MLVDLFSISMTLFCFVLFVFVYLFFYNKFNHSALKRSYTICCENARPAPTATALKYIYPHMVLGLRRR